MPKFTTYRSPKRGINRRSFIGGSDARIIMGSDEAALSVSGARSGEKPSQRT